MSVSINLKNLSSASAAAVVAAAKAAGADGDVSITGVEKSEGLTFGQKTKVDKDVLDAAIAAGHVTEEELSAMREIIDGDKRPEHLPTGPLGVGVGKRGSTFVRFPIGGGRTHEIVYGTGRGGSSWSKTMKTLLDLLESDEKKRNAAVGKAVEALTTAVKADDLTPSELEAEIYKCGKAIADAVELAGVKAARNNLAKRLQNPKLTAEAKADLEAKCAAEIATARSGAAADEAAADEARAWIAAQMQARAEAEK